MDGVDTLVDHYLRQRLARGEISPMTARNHRSALAIFADIVGGAAAEITPTDIERWLETRRHLRPSTRRSQYSYIRTFCGWLVQRGVLEDNPADVVPAPRPPKSVPRALPRPSVERLLTGVNDSRGRAIVWLMVGMGLRCVEVSNLDVEDWDRYAEVMTVRGKFGDERLLPVPSPVGEALAAYLDDHPAVEGPLVRAFRTGDRLRPDSLSGMVSEWMWAADLKLRARDGVSAHALRHTAASDVLDQCKDLRVVQQMLGHQHLSTTSIYLRRASLGDLREAMAGRRYNIGGARDTQAAS